MPAQALAAVATLLSFTADGNRLELRLDRGAAEMVWLTPSTFRFRRSLDGPLPRRDAQPKEQLQLTIDDVPGRIVIHTRHLEVSIQKSGLLVRVRKADGTPLMTDLTEPQRTGRGVAWNRQSPPNERFYGLGPRTEAALDLRGAVVDTEVPLLISTAGYGEYHSAAGVHHFDFAARGRYRIEAPAVDYVFYYGPSPKQIFEEHHETEAVRRLPVSQERGASWEGLRATLLRLVHGAMSAVLEPSVSLRPYADAPADLAERARQLASLVDDVYPGRLGISPFRKQLDTFFSTYAAEAHDRGFPLWHPLPFQFPDDPECARHADEFMLGDEMLVAPIYTPDAKRSVYLPPGVWTNLETNERHQGRQVITSATRNLPVFARNGSIVPIESPEGMALHYFPTLAAEFFLVETDPPEYTQAHAAPAGDIMRLEIESRKARDYQWVVHHIDRPAEVGFEEKRFREVKAVAGVVNGTWYYDAGQRNLHIRLAVGAGEDSIVNLIFP